MDKSEVAAILEEIAVLLELQGENPFRANAYSRAGRTIAQLESSIKDIVEAGTLDQIPGVGETLRDKITTLVTTGKLPFYEDLKAKTPPGLLQMLRLPGMGPKKIKLLYDQLGIDDLTKLKAGCENGTVAKLKGFGEKTQKNILEGLVFLDQMGERVRLDQAMTIAEAIIAELKKAPGIERMELCGSVRRRRETIKDIDILVSSKNAAPIMDAFVSLPMVQKIIGTARRSRASSSGIDHHGSRNDECRPARYHDAIPVALNYLPAARAQRPPRQRTISMAASSEYDLATRRRSDEADPARRSTWGYVPPKCVRTLARSTCGRRQVAAPAESATSIASSTIHDLSDGAASLEQMASGAGLLYRASPTIPSPDHRQWPVAESVRQQRKDMDAPRGSRVSVCSRASVRYPRGRLP